MKSVEELGWEPHTVGELDHRIVKAPYIKLRSLTEGPNGDVVYAIDLRVTQPNTNYLSTVELHSFEHFLLAGFRKYAPKNFISVAPMGCQTGFYLTLFNEGEAVRIYSFYENILNDILHASEVPYANIRECGHFENHNLELAKNLAKKLLENKSSWRQVL
ncbi:MAG: S-ribosylhomocysteine lyase [Anaerolineae bacterium]|nr:S-ribosylhomocysteine lyase [Anaerolineae bacterium]MDK1081727.1 S-ribosylhomocysteine lyase [Anaerolineae bacterium]